MSTNVDNSARETVRYETRVEKRNELTTHTVAIVEGSERVLGVTAPLCRRVLQHNLRRDVARVHLEPLCAVCLRRDPRFTPAGVSNG